MSPFVGPSFCPSLTGGVVFVVFVVVVVVFVVVLAVAIFIVVVIVLTIRRETALCAFAL